MNQNKLLAEALIFGDCHFGRENVNDTIINWNEAISICEANNIKTILFAGDLVLSRAAQTLEILLAVHDVLKSCLDRGIQVIMINGNHCKVNQESPRGYCNVFDSFTNVRIISEWGEVKINHKVGIGMISYFPEGGSFQNKLESLEDYMFEKTKYDKMILVIHEGIRGGLSESTDKELPANLFDQWDKVLVGHYHNRTKIKGTNIEYIGSSRQHNFGEDEEKGYTILYSDGSHKFVKNEVNVRYKVIDVPFEKVNINLYDLLNKTKADGRYKTKVRIHCLTSQASSINKQKLIESGANKVEIITEDIEEVNVSRSSLFEKFDNKQIKKTYEDFCEEKEIADASLGLSYLSKID